METARGDGGGKGREKDRRGKGRSYNGSGKGRGEEREDLKGRRNGWRRKKDLFLQVVGGFQRPMAVGENLSLKSSGSYLGQVSRNTSNKAEKWVLLVVINSCLILGWKTRRRQI